MNCPQCNSENAHKVIAAGLPMKLCFDCETLWGEPFATLYTFVIAPIEGMFNEGFHFMTYEGSYIEALYHWLFNLE